LFAICIVVIHTGTICNSIDLLFAICVVQNKTTEMEDETQSKEGDGDALQDAPKSGTALRAGTSDVSYFLSAVFIISLATPTYPQKLMM
jgi:hypothetical protein